MQSQYSNRASAKKEDNPLLAIVAAHGCGKSTFFDFLGGKTVDEWDINKYIASHPKFKVSFQNQKIAFVNITYNQRSTFRSEEDINQSLVSRFVYGYHKTEKNDLTQFF